MLQALQKTGEKRFVGLDVQRERAFLSWVSSKGELAKRLIAAIPRFAPPSPSIDLLLSADGSLGSIAFHWGASLRTRSG